MSPVVDELGSRLAGVVPELDAPHWNEVEQRAELFGRAAPRPRKRLRLPLGPRALMFAVLLVLTGGSLALAVGDRVLQVFDDEPVPAHVKDELHQLGRVPWPLDGAPPLPRDYLPGAVIRGSERHVLRVRVGPHAAASLYTARTVKGQTCFVAEGGPFRAQGCMSAAQVRPPFSLFSAQQASRGPASTRGVTFAADARIWTTLGRATDRVARTLRVVYADGEHDDVALSDGWFMYVIPSAHTRPGAQPTRLDVLAVSGARLGSRADPFVLKRPSAGFTSPDPASIRLLASAVLPNHGGTVTIWTGRDATGNACFRHLRDGKSQTSPVWDCRPSVGVYGIARRFSVAIPVRRIPVQWQMGLMNHPRHPVGVGYAYAFGWVGLKVASLDIRFQGGASTEIPLHDRYFLYSVPPEHWPAGHRPSILEARDAQGRLIYRQFLYPRQHCIYPGSDSHCQNFGQGTG